MQQRLCWLNALVAAVVAAAAERATAALSYCSPVVQSLDPYLQAPALACHPVRKIPYSRTYLRYSLLALDLVQIGLYPANKKTRQVLTYQPP